MLVALYQLDEKQRSNGLRKQSRFMLSFRIMIVIIWFRVNVIPCYGYYKPDFKILWNDFTR